MKKELDEKTYDDFLLNPSVETIRDYLNYISNITNNTFYLFKDAKKAYQYVKEGYEVSKKNLHYIKSDELNHILFAYILILNIELGAYLKDEERIKALEYELEDTLMVIELEPRFLVDHDKEREEENINKALKISSTLIGISLRKQDDKDDDGGFYYSYEAYNFLKTLKEQYQYKLSSIFTKAGLTLISFLDKMEKYHLASSVYNDIINHQEELVNVKDPDLDEKFNLANMYSNFALYLLKEERINKAINSLMHSLKIYKELLADNKSKSLLLEMLKNYDALNQLLSNIENQELIYKYLQEEYNFLENFKEKLKEKYLKSYIETLKLMIKYFYSNSDFKASLFYIEKVLPLIKNKQEELMMKFNKAGSYLGLKEEEKAKELLLEITKEIDENEKEESLLNLRNNALKYLDLLK